MLYGSQKLWFVRADDWNDLETSSPDAAVGHNIDIWMPRGQGDRAWRKLHNEVQMTWHTLEINHRRELQGQRMVNALWCWDAGPVAEAANGRFDLAVSALDAFMPIASQPEAPAFTSLPASAERTLVVIDSMTPAALASDWGTWIADMEATERNWFAPVLAALDAGQLGRAALVLTDGNRLARCECSRIGLKKFWVKASLERLIKARTT